MRDNFWRADLGGVDWDGVLERYRPVLDRVATHSDLIDLLWEVQGELGTSHAYVSPSGGWTDSTHRQGLLGADLARDEEGVWRVTRVLPSESSDPQARSPLAAPGVAVRAGDAVLAVDGRPVDPLLGPGPLLVGAAGKPVELTVAPAGGGSPGTPSSSPSPTRSRCATTTGSPGGAPTCTRRPAAGSAISTCRTWWAPAGHSSTATCGWR